MPDPLHILFGLVVWLVYSASVALMPYPGGGGFWARFLKALGRVSFLRFIDSPGTLHPPLTAQPVPAACLPGEMAPLPRGNDQPPRSGTISQAGAAKVTVLVMLGAVLPIVAGIILALAGCAATQNDVARQRFTAALKAATDAQLHLRTYDAQHQIALVRAAGTREKAMAALAAYRDRRRKVEQQAQATELQMDEAADQLLLSDSNEATAVASKAATAAQALQQAVSDLQTQEGN